ADDTGAVEHELQAGLVGLAAGEGGVRLRGPGGGGRGVGVLARERDLGGVELGRPDQPGGLLLLGVVVGLQRQLGQLAGEEVPRSPSRRSTSRTRSTARRTTRSRSTSADRAACWPAAAAGAAAVSVTISEMTTGTSEHQLLVGETVVGDLDRLDGHRA